MPDNKLIQTKKDESIVNIDAIQEIIATAHRSGKLVVLDEDAAQQIARFEKAFKLMEEAKKILREQCKVAIEEFGGVNIKDPRGEFLTISISNPKEPFTFEVPDDMNYYQKKVVKYVPNVDRIKTYKEKHGEVPEGIIEKPTNSTVSIRLKEAK